MTDEELAAVREYAGDLLIRAFRGEVDLATGLAELRDLTTAELVEEAEFPDDLDDDPDPDGGDPDPDPDKIEVETLESTEADLTAALEAAGRL